MNNRKEELYVKTYIKKSQQIFVGILLSDLELF